MEVSKYMNYDEEAYVFPLVEGIEVNDFHIHISYFEDGKENNKENFIEQLEEYRKDFKINKMRDFRLSSGGSITIFW